MGRKPSPVRSVYTFPKSTDSGHRTKLSTTDFKRSHTKDVNEICQNALKKRWRLRGQDKDQLQELKLGWYYPSPAQHRGNSEQWGTYHLQRLKVKQLPIIPSADTALTKCEDGRKTFNTFVGLQDFITFISCEHYWKTDSPRLRADQEKRTCKVAGDVSLSKL